MEDLDAVRETEEHLMNAWPSLRTLVCNGWVFRQADGYTKRANSANAMTVRGPFAPTLESARNFYSSFELSHDLSSDAFGGSRTGPHSGGPRLRSRRRDAGDEGGHFNGNAELGRRSSISTVLHGRLGSGLCGRACAGARVPSCAAQSAVEFRPAVAEQTPGRAHLCDLVEIETRGDEAFVLATQLGHNLTGRPAMNDEP
jgi:hypothetical protein